MKSHRPRPSHDLNPVPKILNLNTSPAHTMVGLGIPHTQLPGINWAITMSSTVWKYKGSYWLWPPKKGNILQSLKTHSGGGWGELFEPCTTKSKGKTCVSHLSWDGKEKLFLSLNLSLNKQRDCPFCKLTESQILFTSMASSY